ncbi:MAG: prepilin peptidase [bacterium JZ-2024 1]
MSPTWIYQFKWLYYALFGLAAGSFLNVVIYRLPLGKSLFRPPSSCPFCNALIPWYDNIPIFSFILLGARCRFCRHPISWRYPLVEFVSMMIFLGVYFGRPDLSDLQRAYLIFFLIWLVAIGWIDWDYQIIPESLTYSGWVIGIAGNALLFLPHLERLVDSILGTLGFSFLIWVIRVVGGVAFRREAMGTGDIQLAGMMGAFLGWRASIVAFVIAVFAALGVSPITHYISARKRRRLLMLVPSGAMSIPMIKSELTRFLRTRLPFSEVALGVTRSDQRTEFVVVPRDSPDSLLDQSGSEDAGSLTADQLIQALANAPTGSVPSALLMVLTETPVLSSEDGLQVKRLLLEKHLQLAVVGPEHVTSSESLRVLGEDSGALLLSYQDVSTLRDTLDEFTRYHSYTEVPFGTFLAIGGGISLFAGEYLAYLYVSRFWG